MEDLIIIEAVGKRDTLKKLCTDLGMKVRVFATNGHINTMPNTLTPIGIDSEFKEYAREAKAVWAIDMLKKYASECNNIYIATDADSEGDVIAWDVYEYIKDINKKVSRIKLKGIDKEAIEEAFSTPSEISKDDAIPGRTRSIIDRVIGAVFSKDGMAVGRVSTALLGAIAKDKPTPHYLTLVAPSKDGKRPFIAETPIKKPLNHKIAKQLEEFSFPAINMEKSNNLLRIPNDMSGILISAGDNMDLSPKEASQSMQRLYEGGNISYPRSSSGSINKAAARKMRRIAKKAGFMFNENQLPEKTENAVHDSPHPLKEIDLTYDPKKLDIDDGLMTHIARDIIKTGQKHTEEIGKPIEIRKAMEGKFSKEVIDYVVSLHWRREQGPKYPGKKDWPQSEIKTRRVDTILLEVMKKNNLGKPSTWPNHIDNFMKRDLIDKDMNLTNKGKTWLLKSPKQLINPKISAAIEKACENYPKEILSIPDKEPWEVLSKKIVSVLPKEIKEEISISLEKEKAPEKILDSTIENDNNISNQNMKIDMEYKLK